MLSLSDRIRVALNEDASHQPATVGDLRRVALMIAQEVDNARAPAVVTPDASPSDEAAEG